MQVIDEIGSKRVHPTEEEIGAWLETAPGIPSVLRLSHNRFVVIRFVEKVLDQFIPTKYPDRYCEGFEAAQEMAAMIAEFPVNMPITIDLEMAKHIAEAIRAMEPPE